MAAPKEADRLRCQRGGSPRKPAGASRHKNECAAPPGAALQREQRPQTGHMHLSILTGPSGPSTGYLRPETPVDLRDGTRSANGADALRARTDPMASLV